MQDMWLYITISGFAVSFLLWPYFFSRFRSSNVDSADQEPVPLPVKIEPLKKADSNPVVKNDASGTQPVPAISPVKRIGSEATSPAARVISPEVNAAAAYLKDMKTQLDAVQREMRTVKEQLVDFGQKHESEFEMLINQFGELKDREKDVADLKKQVLIAMQKHDVQFEAVLNEWNLMKTELQGLKEKIGALPSVSSLQAQEPPPSQQPSDVGQATPADDTIILTRDEPHLEFSQNAETAATEPPPDEESPKPKRRGPVWPV